MIVRLTMLYKSEWSTKKITHTEVNITEIGMEYCLLVEKKKQNIYIYTELGTVKNIRLKDNTRKNHLYRHIQRRHIDAPVRRWESTTTSGVR